MTAISIELRQGARPTHSGLIEHAAPALDTVALWRQRVATRRALARLDDEGLRDVGLSRSQASGETSKPFWRA
jgi:uncharacterized protein YjiS (DUF1127 family)